MKAMIVAIIIVLIAFLFLNGVRFDSQVALVIRVPEDANTISEAINLVTPGGEILIGPGRYAEDITIDKPLSLIGSGPNETILVGVNGVEPTRSVVLIESSLKFPNMEVEVRSISVNVDDTQPFNTAIAIYSQGSVSLDLNECHVKAPSGIIDFTMNSSITVANCNFEILDSGITSFNESYNPDNKITVTGNNFEPYKSERAIAYRNSDTLSLLMGMNLGNKNVEIRNNNFSNAIFALFAVNVNGDVSNNIFSENDVGVLLGGTSNVILQKNTFSNNYYYGIVLASSTECKIISSALELGTNPDSTFTGNTDLLENDFVNNAKGSICPP